MSQLLDALKRSEQRRQQLQPKESVVVAGPVVGATPTKGSDQKPISKLLQLALALIVSLVLIFAAVFFPSAIRSDLFDFRDSPRIAKNRSISGGASFERTAVSTPQDIKTSGLKQVFPRIEALPQAILQQLPDLAFTYHEYAEQSARRHVVINGHKLGEGDQVEPGLLLESITPGGVVLDYTGVRFYLNLLQSWAQDRTQGL